MKQIFSNKKAYFNFDVLDKVESGIILYGWEVKSLKNGRIDVSSAYIKEKNGELFLIGSKIPNWKSAQNSNYKLEDRDRKLLAHKKEIVKLVTSAKQSGVTMVPLDGYINDSGIIKITVALVRGKKKFDKRAKIKERDLKRRIDSDRKKYNI